MKRLNLLAFAMFLFLGMLNSNAQQDDCLIKYNLFRGDYKAKNYDRAYENWIWCMDNCPTLSVNIYKNGATIAKYKYDNAAEADKPAAMELIKRVYEQRLENYPKDQGKVYSDYAKAIEARGASADEVFVLYEKAFQADPSKMGVKAIYKYFDGVVERKKDSDVQYIFDTYDDVIEGVNKKMENYSNNLLAYNEKLDAGQELSSKDAKRMKAYEVNLRALGQIQGGLDAKLTEIASCDNLVDLYSKNLAANQTNAKWLKRAVSRMFNKECTDAPIYVDLVDAYQTADPSPEASVFYATVLLKQGKKSEAVNVFKQAIEQETDNYKKAGYLYKVANLIRTSDKVAARRSALQAIKLRPGYGQAYLLIADLYARSANDCGNNVFEKKMTYVAALNYALKAQRLDPSISSQAKKYVKSYAANIPDKKLVFQEGLEAGSSYTIKCWINETVKIP
ncbi:MAG: hypothetical protein ACPGR7_09540 [Flavobacteriaceae bacterium]